MGIDYTSLFETMQRLIEENGRTIQIRVNEVVGDEFDPTIIPTDTPVKAVQTRFSQRDVDGKRILSTDKKLVFAYPGFTVTKDMQFVDGSTVLRVPTNGMVQEIKPGDTIIGYFIQVRS